MVWGSAACATAITVAILARVRALRWLVTCMLLLGALALAIPAVTLASGGGSAGDQQYTDPFAGTAPGKSKPKTHHQRADDLEPAGRPHAGGHADDKRHTGGQHPASSDPTTPTATIASTTTGELPHTGYDGWLAASWASCWWAVAWASALVCAAPELS